MNKLTGLIKCQMCGKNFNFKNNNGTLQYICQTRKNKGLTACVSPLVGEKFLVDIIQKHCELENKKFTESKIKLFVKEIKVDDKRIKIIYKDGTVSEIRANSIEF